MLDIPYAYHTPQLLPIHDAFLETVSKVTFRPPTLPIFAGIHAQIVIPKDPTVLTADYLVRHVLDPVHFHTCV